MHAEGATICMVTHNPESFKFTERDVQLSDGKTVGGEQESPFVSDSSCPWHDARLRSRITGAGDRRPTQKPAREEIFHEICFMIGQ